MKPTEQGAGFVITVRPLPGDRRTPEMRLKALLKIAKRSLGLECTSAIPSATEERKPT